MWKTEVYLSCWLVCVVAGDFEGMRRIWKNEYCGMGSSLDRDFSSDGFRMFRNVPQKGMMKDDSLNIRERSRFFCIFDQTLI